VKKRLDIDVKASGFLTKSLEENLKQLELLDNYNKMMREFGTTTLDENYNSEDDEQMLELDSEGEEREGNEEEKKEEDEEEKVESEEGDEEESDEEEDEEESDEEEEEEDKDKKKSKPKEKKEKKEKKKKDDKKEDDDEYIDNIMKKKFKPRRVVRSLLKGIDIINVFFRSRRTLIKERRSWLLLIISSKGFFHEDLWFDLFLLNVVVKKKERRFEYR